jgi:phosphoglycerate dehydrogenase-like enzyme
MPKIIAVMNAMARPLLEPRLPDWIEPRWFSSTNELLALAPEAEIGWFDAFDGTSTERLYRSATRLKWLVSMAAGLDSFPMDLLQSRGVLFTNGAGVNSITIAEYAVMGMLTIAKGYRAVVRAQDRHEWLDDAPGKQELYGTKALILGAGGIGGRLAELLAPFGVEVTMARRSPAPDALGPDEWRARLGEWWWRWRRPRKRRG